MHGEYNGGQQIARFWCKDMAAKNSPLLIDEQFHKSSGSAFGNGALNIFKIHTSRPVLYFFLPQLLFRFAYMGQGRIAKGYPRNNAAIKWLRFLRKSIMGRQFSLLIGNMSKL